MKNFTINLGLSILTVFSLLVSCSTDDTDDLQSEALVSENTSLSTSGNSCGGAVDFEDLEVETSWISNNKDDRDAFGACGVDGESWFDKYSDGRVMMKCKKGDGHRTELKEAVGDEDKLTKYKRMEFTAKFSSLPEHGVTIAQIHNRNSSVKRPWIRLYIDSDRKIKIKETETTPNQSQSTYTTSTGFKYVSGKAMTVTIWTGQSGNEKAKFKIESEGNTFQKTLYPSSAWDNYDDDYYLKAGVYTEGDDKEAKVIYSEFDINH